MLTLRVRQTHARWVSFTVIDAGPGIAPEVAQQLFTPFFTTRAEGMGLGLSLCRTVIEQHGGALDFSARRRAAAAPSSVHAAGAAQPPKPSRGTGLRTVREPMHLDPSLGLPVVYLVDDEDVVRDALAWLLRSRRLLSEGFASAEAFEAFLGRRAATPWPDAPSCLLLDVRMPGTSGLVLFERLVERGLLAALPVIFLTGHGDVPTAVAAVKRGAFDFVEKPFSNNALVDRVEQALQASAAALLRRRDARRRAARAGRADRARARGDARWSSTAGRTS